MPQLALKRAGGVAYREADQVSDRLPALCIHGWPQSSYMWRHLLPALALAGRRALAPDLPGFGDSLPDPPGTFERHVEAVERLRRQIGLDRIVLVVHDTGGLIGLRWACDHPDAVAGLVITNTGFFPDHEWIETAKTMLTPIQGEGVQLCSRPLGAPNKKLRVRLTSGDRHLAPWQMECRASPARS